MVSTKLIMFKYLRMAMKEAKKQKEEDQRKARLLSKDMDFAYLEQIVQKMNENPLLRVRITLKDGTTLDLNTTPKKNGSDFVVEPYEDFQEVK